MDECTIIERFNNLVVRAADYNLTIGTGSDCFLIQNKTSKILSTPKTVGAISSFLDGVDYATSKDYK